MCFCLLLVVYTKIQERKIHFLFLYQNSGCPGLQGTKIISIYISILPEDMHISVSTHCWSFIESLIFSTFSIQIFKNAKSNFGFCTKKLVVQGFRVLHLSLYTTLLLWEDSHRCVMLSAGDK